MVIKGDCMKLLRPGPRTPVHPRLLGGQQSLPSLTSEQVAAPHKTTCPGPPTSRPATLPARVPHQPPIHLHRPVSLPGEVGDTEPPACVGLSGSSPVTGGLYSTPILVSQDALPGGAEALSCCSLRLPSPETHTVLVGDGVLSSGPGCPALVAGCPPPPAPRPICPTGIPVRYHPCVLTRLWSPHTVEGTLFSPGSFLICAMGGQTGCVPSSQLTRAAGLGPGSPSWPYPEDLGAGVSSQLLHLQQDRAHAQALQSCHPSLCEPLS